MRRIGPALGSVWLALSIPFGLLFATGMGATAVADTTPPTIGSARVIHDPLNPSDTTALEFIFSEPVDWFAATSLASYTDVNTGANADQIFWFPPNRTRVEFVTGFGFGSCEQVKVVAVKDTTGNVIVDDGVGNVLTFHLQQWLVRGRMNEHMTAHDAPPHSFSIEGGVEPLSWSPLCDLDLVDAEGDSIWTRSLFFCVPCSTAIGGAETKDVDFRFAHLCSELEPLVADRIQTLDLAAHPDGRDTLDLWWNDVAPANFTAQEMDVIFRVRAASFAPPFGPGDSLGIVGSEYPLSWDDPPLIRLRDDGIAPDDVAGDGIASTRHTFPVGTFRDLQYRFVRRSLPATTFSEECSTEPHRTAYLDDEVYSKTVPFVVDVVYGDCSNATDAPSVARNPASPLRVRAFPNPARGSLAIAFSQPVDGSVTLDVVDVRGRRVRRLLRAERPAGPHRVVWDGRTESGASAPAGVYFVRLEVGERAVGHRVVLTR